MLAVEEAVALSLRLYSVFILSLLNLYSVLWECAEKLEGALRVRQTDPRQSVKRRRN